MYATNRAIIRNPSAYTEISGEASATAAKMQILTRFQCLIIRNGVSMLVRSGEYVCLDGRPLYFDEMINLKKCVRFRLATLTWL